MGHMILRPISLVALENTQDIAISGEGRVSDMTVEDASFGWTTAPFSIGLLAAAINDKIKDAGVAGAAEAGFTVGALDKKYVLGGVIGL